MSKHDRESLSDIFHHTLGIANVYFQPPSNMKIQYPCLVYKRVGWDETQADDQLYTAQPHYQLTWITKDPDSEMPLQLLKTFRMIRHASHFTSDYLYHDTFDLYF